MKNLILEKSKKRFWNDKLLKILVFSLILGFYASFLIVTIHLTELDNDAGLYITDGKIIWQTQKVFRNNIYSYTEPNHPVYDHHWLSSVTFYLTTEITGFGGLTILKTIVLLMAFTLLFIAAMKKANFWLAALFSWPTILILSYRTRIRPEMFSYLFIALFLYLLFDLEKNPASKRIYWLIPLQLLWVNFHLFFFVGIALVGGFLFEKIVLNMPNTFLIRFNWAKFKNLIGDKVIKKLILLLPILILVCLINPNGIEGALAPFRSHSYATFTVSENQPLFNLKVSFLSWDLLSSPFVPMVVIFIFSFIFGFRQKQKPFNYAHGKPIFLFLAGLGAAGAGLIHVRLLSLFAIIFLPAVSSNFNDVYIKIGMWLKRKWPKKAAILGYTLALSIAFLFPYKAYNINSSAASRGYPTDWGIGLDRESNDAGKFFKEQNLKGPIFNDYDIGGYIIYHLFPNEKVFVDNNGADSYPVSFFDDIFMPTLVRDEKWKETQEKYGINSIFISIRDGSPIVGGFLFNRLHDPAWALVYVDTYAVILVRNVPENEEIIKKFQITPENVKEKLAYMLESNVVNKIMAGRLIYLIGREDLSTSILKKVVAEYPKNSWVWLYMGSLKALRNDPQSLASSIIFLENAVNMGEKTSDGYTWLGLAYFKFGQFEKAEAALQKALRLDPGRYDTTNYLNQLQQYLNH